MPALFDEWAKRYEAWFETPLGRLVKQYETRLIQGMLRPRPGEKILDAGCGTGVFTQMVLEAGAQVVGLELSGPMLAAAKEKLGRGALSMIQGDMIELPLADESFDKALSVTALEFIADAQGAVRELFRVTRPGGLVVVATLNRLSPWAAHRKKAGAQGHSLFRQAIFRSPDELSVLAPVKGEVRTAIHFLKDHHPEQARSIENSLQPQGLDTGAFLAACWQRPS
jgi:ubiquinone/menaquinone biosynthesis C-methylase UbiE